CSFFTAPLTSHICTLSLHDALPIFQAITMLDSMNSAEDFSRCGNLSQQLQFSFYDHPLIKVFRNIRNYDGHFRTLNYNQINGMRSEEHTSELQSRFDLVCRLLLEQK